MGGNLTKIERGYLRNEHHRAKILGTLMRCANIFETQHHQHIAVKKKKEKMSTKPSPELRLKVFRFFSRLQSWHSNQKNYFGDIKWFASRVSTKPSQQEPIATH